MSSKNTESKLIMSRCLEIFLILSSLTQVHCDYYTSVAGLEKLLEADKYLIEAYDNYLEKVHQTNQEIKSFLSEVEKTIGEIEADPEGYYSNPLNAFKTIKRIVVDWKRMEHIVMVDNAANDFTANYSIMTSGYYVNATQEDLGGASRGLARLQRTYALKSEDIANGILMEHQYNTHFSAHDCFEIGRFLHAAGINKYCADWLLQARMLLYEELEEYEDYKEKLSPDFPYLSDVEILEFLGPSLFLIGNFKMAKIMNDELLAQDPENNYGLQNHPIFETRLLQERRMMSVPEERDPVIDDGLDELAEAVCRGSVHRTPSEERHLRCRYVNNNVPYCLIAPFKMEELNDDPFVAIYHDTIYENEIQGIINETEKKVERSKVGDISQSKVSEYRTSKTAWLDYRLYSFLNPLYERLKHITRLDMESAEFLQVVNYGIGGHYGVHHDFSDTPDTAYPGKGNRIATALFYINNVELGGATAFPHLRLAVQPQKGSLLVWHNMHESLELDYRTLHTGCPVLKGSKWITNEWFHQHGQEFTRPCSLERTGEISLPFKNY